MKAIWNGVVLAESDACVMVEGVPYFPPESVNRVYLRPSTTRTICHWKGTANYFDVVVEGATNTDAAWYYPYPKPAANKFKAYLAFWHGVEIER